MVRLGMVWHAEASKERSTVKCSSRFRRPLRTRGMPISTFDRVGMPHRTLNLSSDSHAFQPSQSQVAEEGETAVPFDAGAPGVFCFESAEGLGLDTSVVEAA